MTCMVENVIDTVGPIHLSIVKKAVVAQKERARKIAIGKTVSLASVYTCVYKVLK